MSCGMPWCETSWTTDWSLYLGSSRAASLLEVIVLRRTDLADLAIHAVPLRDKYRRLLPGG